MVRKESQDNWSEIGRDKETKVSVTEAKITENLEKQYLIKCHEEVQENDLWEEKSVEICMGVFSIWGKLFPYVLRMTAKLSGSWMRDEVIRRRE